MGRSGAMKGSLSSEHSRRSFQQHLEQLRDAGGYGWALPDPAYRPPSSSRHPQLAAQLHEDLGQFLGNHYSPSQIPDIYDYESLGQVSDALAKVGVEGLTLIVGIDFTKSNEFSGIVSFDGRSLHHISSVQNPYEKVLSVIGETLSTDDENNIIHCFGFGDESTRDQHIFCFYPCGRPCNGYSEALERYRELTLHLSLAEPTSFAPIIEMAITTVERSGRQYHVLLIITNGQVMRSVDTAPWHVSSEEQRTINAIVKASEFPLSIILVGVGDGPWDMMEEFVDKIPTRAFDNFRFVNFTEIMSKNMAQSRKEAAFALSVLMEIPQQYQAIMELGLLGCGSRIPLPPPPTATDDNIPVGGFYDFHTMSKNLPQSRKEAALMEPQQNKAHEELHPAYDTCSEPESTLICLECGSRKLCSVPVADDPHEPSTHELCLMCCNNPKDMVFGCGHVQTCCDCGRNLETCPICRSPITTRIKLY